MSAKKKNKRFSIVIERNCSDEIIVSAPTPGKAKTKGWGIFARRKPKEERTSNIL